MVKWMTHEHIWFILCVGAFLVFMFIMRGCNDDVRLYNLKVMCAKKGLGWDANTQACMPKEKAP